jgi:hypothetical protein
MLLSVHSVLSDGLIIGVGRQFLKILSQTQESDTIRQELNVLVLLSFDTCRNYMDRHPTQGASPASRSIHHQSPWLLFFLFFIFQNQINKLQNNI